MEQYNDEIQLKDLLSKLSEYTAFLFKKKVAIISFSFLCFVIGVGYSFISEEKYNAKLTFVVESDKGSTGSLGGIAGIASQFGFDIGGSSSSTFSPDNVIELLKSRGVIVNTLMQNGKVNGKTDLLIEHYFEINKTKEDWAEDNFEGVSFHEKNSYIHDSITGGIWRAIYDNLTIELESESERSSILTLTYTSLNESFAKEFVEKLINQMSKMYITHQTVQANNTLNFLQDRADSVFAELEIAEKAFAKTKDINQRIVKVSGRLKELQLMRRVEVLNTMYLEIVKNRELSKITLLNRTPIINIIDKPILPLQGDVMSKKTAGLFGLFIGGFLSICYFVFMKLFRDALEES